MLNSNVIFNSSKACASAVFHRHMHYTVIVMAMMVPAVM